MAAQSTKYAQKASGYSSIFNLYHRGKCRVIHLLKSSNFPHFNIFTL